jgi:hypothetical protein
MSRVAYVPELRGPKSVMRQAKADLYRTYNQYRYQTLTWPQEPAGEPRAWELWPNGCTAAGIGLRLAVPASGSKH